MLLLSYIIHATSAKAYERLIEEQVLMLPSVKTFKKITMNVNKTAGLDDSEYLHMRFSKLNAFDRNVVLMINKIYLSKRIESSSVQLVYDKECDKPLRIAHKLLDTVLKPKTIEKVNVKLALSVLHGSTVIGLKQFNCSETAAMIELFIKFWSIVNVSDPTTGKHKRNIYQDPIRSLNDWKIEFLESFEQYITFWENSKVCILLILPFVKI